MPSDLAVERSASPRPSSLLASPKSVRWTWPSRSIRTFDGYKDHKVAHTFDNLFADLPASVPFPKIRTGAIQLQVRAGASGLNVLDDGVDLGFYGSGGPGAVWGADFPQLVTGWTNGSSATIALDLSSLPVSDGSNMNLIPA